MLKTKSPPQPPRKDALAALLSWVAAISAIVSLVLSLNLHDAADRGFLIAWAAVVAGIFALWGYGRLFVLPKMNQRQTTRTVPSFTPIRRGPFTGWNPRVVRTTIAACVVFIVAGSSAGLLIMNAQPIFGGIAAAIALFAFPQVLAVALALLLRGTLKVNRPPSSDAV